MRRRKTKNAAHLMETDEHGTPPEFVDLAHDVMGDLDLDPASSPAWNKFVRARRFITVDQGFQHTPWTEGAPRILQLRTNVVEGYGERLRVFFNSPSDDRGELVALAWFGLTWLFTRGWVSSAIWIGFNVEQLSRLQRVEAATHPLAEMTVVPPERPNFRSERTGQIQSDAAHAGYVTLLSRDSLERERFAGAAGALGYVINGDRR